MLVIGKPDSGAMGKPIVRINTRKGMWTEIGVIPTTVGTMIHNDENKNKV